MTFLKEHEMTPEILVNELNGTEKAVFKKLFGGRISRTLLVPHI